MFFESLESRTLLSSAAPVFPLDKLPWNIRKIADGSRAAWSPDGTRIAYVDHQFGNAYEYDLATHKTRMLTSLIKNPKILRVQYLPNGDYLFIAPAKFVNTNVSRWNDAEIWVMRHKHRSIMYRMGQKLYEGIAIARDKSEIAWVADQRQYPGTRPTLYTADITYSPKGIPHLANKTTRFSQSSAMEAQDFRASDGEIIYVDYTGSQASVRGFTFSGKKITTYRTSSTEYNEPEGIFPNGDFELIESSRDKGNVASQSQHIDLWKLQLKPHSNNFVRLTRFGDYGPFEASNGVVSPDGTMIAFQQSTTGAIPGTGEGVYVMQLAPTPQTMIQADSFDSRMRWMIGGDKGGKAWPDGRSGMMISGGSNGHAVSTSITRRFSTVGFSKIMIRLNASQMSAAYSSSDSLRIEVDTGSGFQRLLTDGEQFNGMDNAAGDKTTGEDANVAGATTGYLALPTSAANGSIRVRIIVTTTQSNEAYRLSSFAIAGTRLA
jgi:hypothetical protein